MGLRLIDFRGLHLGVGWLLDIAIHPDYEKNGWVYLHCTDLCTEGYVQGTSSSLRQ